MPLHWGIFLLVATKSFDMDATHYAFSTSQNQSSLSPSKWTSQPPFAYRAQLDKLSELFPIISNTQK